MSNQWEQQVCPFFTVGRMISKSTAKSAIIGGPTSAQEEQMEPLSCIGPMCALFIPESDPETGKLTGTGACCFKTAPLVTQTQTMVMAPIANWIASRNNMKINKK